MAGRTHVQEWDSHLFKETRGYIATARTKFGDEIDGRGRTHTSPAGSPAAQTLDLSLICRALRSGDGKSADADADAEPEIPAQTSWDRKGYLAWQRLSSIAKLMPMSHRRAGRSRPRTRAVNCS
jgi:hypothetical protein